MKNVYIDNERVANLYQRNDGTFCKIDYSWNNYILHYDETGKCTELILFQRPFKTPEHSELNADILNDKVTVDNVSSLINRRKFILTESGAALPIADTISPADLFKCAYMGQKRAVKNFYDYAMANTWEYFCTFTFSSEEYRNSKDLMYYGWSEFCKSLQKRNKDFKGLAVYELFQNGGFHMHAVLSDIDLRLVPARINNRESLDYGKFIYSPTSGVQVFNTVDWTKGFNTVVPINPNSDNARIVNYLCKYMLKNMSKDNKDKNLSPVPYGCKRFFHTRNLGCREVLVGYDKNAHDLVEKLGLKPVKVSNGMYIYRNYGNKFIEDKCDKLLHYEYDIDDDRKELKPTDFLSPSEEVEIEEFELAEIWAEQYAMDFEKMKNNQ